MSNCQRQNILIIYADQHRCDCIGAYGNKDIKTPNLDRLAEDGVLYKESYCTFPVCTPSRYSLLTGLYVHQHLGWTNHCTLPNGLETFPQIMKEEGYRTAAVGKMHFTPTYLDVGFKEMQLSEQNGNGRYDDDYHRYLKSKGKADLLDTMDQVNEYRSAAPKEYWDSFGAVESDLKEEDYSTTWIAHRAMENLDKWESGGNLLMVGFIKPHHPIDPPAPWSRMYDPEKLRLLPGWTQESLKRDLSFRQSFFPNAELTEETVRKCMALYYASISQIDYHIGKMTELLIRKGLYDNTMIIYTSDHGDYMGYHHMILKGNYMYDPLIKVPLIVKYPGQMPRSVVSDAMFSSIDLTVTMLKQVGCRTGEFMKGLDMTADCKGRDYVFAESGIGLNYMVRSRTRKLLLSRTPGHSLFFDLEKDPYEMENLYNHADYQKEIAEYKDVLARWILFEAPAPVCLDEYAAVVSGSNVPQPQGNHRKEMQDYFREKMKTADEIFNKGVILNVF